MLQNRPLTVPEQRQHHFTRWMFCTKVFVFQWIRMSPLFFAFSAFILLLCAEEKYSFHFGCTHFVVLENIVHNMVSTAMANTKFQSNLISCYATVFLCYSFKVHHSHWCISSVRPTWAISISYTWHPILELSVPLVNLLQQYTSISILHSRSSIISVGFTTSLVKKRITGMLFFWYVSIVEQPSLIVPMTSHNQYCQHAYLQVTSTSTGLKQVRVPYTVYSHLYSLFKVFDWLSPHPHISASSSELKY